MKSVDEYNKFLNESKETTYLSFDDVKKGETLYKWVASTKKEPVKWYKVKIEKVISDEKGHERFMAKYLDGDMKGKSEVVMLNTLSKKMD